MSQLNAHVHVQDESGKNHVFKPGDDVPEWAVAKITNPKVWDGDAPAVDLDAAKAAEEQAAKEAEAAKAAEAEAAKAAEEAAAAAKAAEEAANATGKALTIPSKVAGKTEDWATYAKAAIAAKGLNIEIPSDAKRKDIIEALEGAGIATE